MRRTIPVVSLAFLALSSSMAFAQNNQPRNLILFVPDGLRALKVTPETAPAMAEIRDKGVNFKNSHSLFPTFTMANASGMSTGHYLGDTGTFSNSIYTGHPVAAQNGSVVPFLEHDQVLRDVDEQFGGDYLDEEALLKAARNAGYSTAAVGKLGPTLLFDHTERTGTKTITIDDQTGAVEKDGSLIGIPLSDEMKAALNAANLPSKPPDAATTARPVTQNAGHGDRQHRPAGLLRRRRQQGGAADVQGAQQAVRAGVLVTRSGRHPAQPGRQPQQADTRHQRTRFACGHQERRQQPRAVAQDTRRSRPLGVDQHHRLRRPRLLDDLEGEQDQPIGEGTYPDTPEGFLPLGFLAIDLAKALDLPLFDPNDKNARVGDNAYPKAGNGVLGKDPTKPEMVIATNGGSDLIYIPSNDRKLAGRTVKALLEQDYVSGIFVDDNLGRFPGALPMSALNLNGRAVTPHPSIVVNFRSYAVGCDEPTLCSVEIADTVLRQGQGMHGSFSRGDTMNFMAAMGPDFKAGYVDTLPVSNADVGMTAAKLLGISRKANGKLIGRVMTEAMPNGATPKAFTGTLTSKPDANGLRTVLQFQRVLEQRYFDVAGFPGRTVGLEADKKTAGVK